MLPVIKSQVASGRAEQSGRHGRPVPSQLPSPSASYKQATMLPSSSSPCKDGLRPSLTSPNNNKQINNKQTTQQQQQLSSNISANTTTTTNTSMLPLPSPNNNLAATANQKSYHQNVGITNGGGYNDNTMTRWVKLRDILQDNALCLLFLFFTNPYNNLAQCSKIQPKSGIYNYNLEL